MDKTWIYTILIVIIVGGTVPHSAWNTETTIERTYYDVYQATFPFGTITSRGHIDGGGGLFMWSLSGEIYPSEVYSVKYLSGNKLWTALIDAELSPIVIDGTFQLEKVVTKTYEPALYFWKHLIKINVGYILHIPCLPETNQTSQFKENHVK